MGDIPQMAAAHNKSYITIRREIGEANAAKAVDDTKDFNPEFFDIKRPRIKYPEQFETHPEPIRVNPLDPFGHLGRIGYTRNTYQFRGTNKDKNNIYGKQHMKKTAWLEEIRRRIIAESEGISADVDDTCIAGTGQAFYLSTREKRNAYYGAATIQSKVKPWNSQTHNQTSLKK